jgi:vacuolar-type H+-ATPase subunit H
LKEVIQEILDEEKLARERIDNARQQARRATEAAQAEAQKLIEDARREALREAEKILTTARTKAGAEQAAQINAAREKQKTILDNYHNEIAAAVDFLFRALPTGDKAQS